MWYEIFIIIKKKKKKKLAPSSGHYQNILSILLVNFPQLFCWTELTFC